MKNKKKLISLLTCICLGIGITLGFSVNSYATEGATQGVQTADSVLQNNKGKKSSSYSNVSNAHKEKSEKNKKENGDVSASEASSWLQSHNKWVQFGSFMTWLGHTIGWFVIKGVYFVASYVESALTSILAFVSQLFGGGLVNDILSGFPAGATALAWTILGTAIAFFGIRYMIKGEKIDFKNTMMNVILIAVFLVSSSTIINQFVNAGIGTFNDAKATAVGSKGGTFSLKLIQDNVVDVKKAIQSNDENKLSNKNDKGYNNITDAFLWSADMAQIYKPKEENEKDSKISKIMEYQINDVNDKGQIIASKIDNGWFDIFKSGYFRFGTQFFNIITGLIIMAVAFALYGYLLLRNAIDLIFTKLVGGIASAMDIEKGTKLKTVIIEVGKSALGFAFTGISLCIFVRLFTVINNQDWNPVAQVIALIAATIACLDGAKIFDRLFGVDVGIRSGWEAMVGGFAGAKTAGNAISGMAKGASSVIGAGYSGAKNVTNGVIDSIKNGASDSSSNNHSSFGGGGLSPAVNNEMSTSTNKDSQSLVDKEQESTNNQSAMSQSESMVQEGSDQLENQSHVDTDGSVSAYSDSIDNSTEEANVDTSGSVSAHSDSTENIDAEASQEMTAINEGTDLDGNDEVVDASGSAIVEGNTVNAEDNDVNSLNEDVSQAINNENSVHDESNINETEMMTSNGVVDNGNATIEASHAELSSDIEGLEAKINNSNNDGGAIPNGVDIASATGTEPMNDFDGANGLNEPSMSFDSSSDGDSSYLGANQPTSSISTSSLNGETMNQSGINQPMNHQSGNSTVNMPNTSSMGVYQTGNHANASNSFDPTRRSSNNIDSQISMPNVDHGGSKEPFDHTH